MTSQVKVYLGVEGDPSSFHVLMTLIENIKGCVPPDHLSTRQVLACLAISAEEHADEVLGEGWKTYKAEYRQLIGDGGAN